MSQTIRLTIIHRNRLFRECLASVLSDDKRFKVADVDHTDLDCRKLVLKSRPDVVLIDLNLPDQLAVDLIRYIGECAESAKVLLLTHTYAHEDLFECVAAGASGCVLEKSSLQNLQLAVEKVARGETFCSPEIVHSMFQTLAQTTRAHHRSAPGGEMNLTPRELQIVHLIADGLANKQIARRLSLSLHTVKNHVHNVIERLHVENRFEAVEYARRQKWLQKSTIIGSSLRND